MRILHILPYYRPAHRYGGPVNSVHGLCKALVQAGVDVTVFTTNIDGDNELDVPVGTPVFMDGVEVYYYPVQQPRNYIYSAPFRNALKKHLPSFDVVHIHGLYTYPTTVTSRLCRRLHVPYIVAPRGMLDQYAMKTGGLLKQARKRLYLDLIERTNLDAAAVLHFTAVDELHHSLYACTPERAVIVANGLSIETYEQRSETAVSSNTVLFLSRIHPKKGLDLLIPAFAEVIKQYPYACLRLVGPDNDGYFAHIEALIAHHQLHDHVQYDGMLLGKEKVQAMQQAALFVLPSYSENFGMVVIEALACGTPVLISNRVNIYHEIEQAQCGVVTDCDVASIAQGILRMLAHPEETRQMGQRGRKLVEEKFTWTAVAQSMLSVYEKVIAAHSL